MRTKELMIGDWVECYSKSQCQLIQTKTKEVLDGYIYDDKEDIYYFGNIKPIPLTEEILISNKIDTSEPFCFSRNHLIQLTWIDSKLYWTVNSEYSLICFDYVHQLQHALRLCGLHDIADNFKLK